MKLKDIITPIEGQSDEELRERLRAIRFNREKARPVAKKKEAKAEQKASRTRVSSTEKMLAGLSQDQLEALLKKLTS